MCMCLCPVCKCVYVCIMCVLARVPDVHVHVSYNCSAFRPPMLQLPVQLPVGPRCGLLKQYVPLSIRTCQTIIIVLFMRHCMLPLVSPMVKFKSYG